VRAGNEKGNSMSKSNTAQSQVIASIYITANGQHLLELVEIPEGGWVVTKDGRLLDARQKLTREQARAWYDEASRQFGPRP
jgi:hypothetical protein